MSVQAVCLIDLCMTEGLFCNYFIKSTLKKTLSNPGLEPDMAAWD